MESTIILEHIVEDYDIMRRKNKLK